MKFSRILFLSLFSLILVACGLSQGQNSAQSSDSEAAVTGTSSSGTAETSSQLPSKQALEADPTPLDIASVDNPANLGQNLSDGGYVFVFRYTGAGGERTAVPENLQGQVIDDGQRISDSSVEKMGLYGQKYRDLGVEADHILTSEYYFVWQHAQAAFGDNLEINRDLTGSLNFSDDQELEQSLQNLRNRTIQVPEAGKSTILFTHQGKFDKAYGYYIPAGTTLVFKPDGSNQPKLIAVLTFEEFLNV